MAPIHARKDTGQAALEFALVSLFLMTIFFGLLDLGRGVFQRQDLANAAREAARFAMVSSDAHAKSATGLAADVATAASRRSPSLNLTASNFSAVGGGRIICDTWGSARTTAPTGGWTTIACAQATPGDHLTTCVGYSFRPATTLLLGIGAIPMTDCASVTVQ